MNLLAKSTWYGKSTQDADDFLRKSTSWKVAQPGSSELNKAGISQGQKTESPSSSCWLTRSQMMFISLQNVVFGALCKSSQQAEVKKLDSFWWIPELSTMTLTWCSLQPSTKDPTTSWTQCDHRTSMAVKGMADKGIYASGLVFNLHRSVRAWSWTSKWWWSCASSQEANMLVDNKTQPLLPHAEICMLWQPSTHTPCEGYIQGQGLRSRPTMSRLSLWDGLWTGALHDTARGDCRWDQCCWRWWCRAAGVRESSWRAHEPRGRQRPWNGQSQPWAEEEGWSKSGRLCRQTAQEPGSSITRGLGQDADRGAGDRERASSSPGVRVPQLLSQGKTISSTTLWRNLFNYFWQSPGGGLFMDSAGDRTSMCPHYVWWSNSLHCRPHPAEREVHWVCQGPGAHLGASLWIAQVLASRCCKRMGKQSRERLVLRQRSNLGSCPLLRATTGLESFAELWNSTWMTAGVTLSPCSKMQPSTFRQRSTECLSQEASLQLNGCWARLHNKIFLWCPSSTTLVWTTSMRPRTLPTFSRNDCKLALPSSRPTLTQSSEEPWTRSSTRVRTRCWLDNAAGTGVSKDLDISRNQNGVGQHDVSHKSFPTMVERWWFIGWCMALHCCDAHQHMWDHSRKPYVKFKVNEITTSLPGVKKNANPGRWLRPSGSCDNNKLKAEMDKSW